MGSALPGHTSHALRLRRRVRPRRPRLGPPPPSTSALTFNARGALNVANWRGEDWQFELDVDPCTDVEAGGHGSAGISARCRLSAPGLPAEPAGLQVAVPPVVQAGGVLSVQDDDPADRAF